MKKLSPEIKKFIKIGNLPQLFERYEIFVILAGIVFVFLFAGWIFYQKAYKTVTASQSPSVQLPTINKSLFEKTVKEIEQKKQPATSSAPIVDPFR